MMTNKNTEKLRYHVDIQILNVVAGKYFSKNLFSDL